MEWLPIDSDCASGTDVLFFPALCGLRNAALPEPLICGISARRIRPCRNRARGIFG